MARCLVIVSREEPELFERLAALYAQEGWIEVRLDRRHGPHGRGNRPDRRARPSPHMDLQKHGLIVMPRPYIAAASR